jgi:bifunctional ADP-heptose synthase (sugar kinase/adenylyltransferase)
MSKKILVIGESCLDIHLYCSTERMCPDRPVPILKVTECTKNPGMAGNVHRNIRTAIDDCTILTNSNWQDVTKTRFVHGATNHMFFRLDSSNPVPRCDLGKLSLGGYDHVVVADYDKGFLDERGIEFICKSHPSTFLDTKKALGPWAEYATFVKINEHEYSRSNDIGPISDELKKTIIMTAGKKGAFHQGEQFPVEQLGVMDTSGAGDSFMAGLVIEYSKSGDIKAAIRFANQCATNVVQQRGVSVI